MPNKLIKNSFNAGELSQYMDGRTDLAKYYNGCSKLINALVLPHGGFTKRPGTIYKAAAPGKANLIPFEFSVDDALVLEFSDSLIRFYKDQSLLYIPYGTEDLSGAGTPISHWKMDDNDSNTTVTDAQGSHDGAATSNTDTMTHADIEGTANEALDMGGTDAVVVADHADFTFGDAANDDPFSLVGWFELITGSSQTLISKYNSGLAHYEYRLHIDAADYLNFDLFDDSLGSGGKITIKTTNVISAGWHFIAITYSGEPNVAISAGSSSSATLVGVNIYIDFVKVPAYVSFINNSYVAMEDTAAEFIIGGYKSGGALVNEWEGAIDNVSVWDKELSFADIAALAGSSNSTTPVSLISPYDSTDIFEIHYTQSADVMYIAHEDHHPQKISRFADIAWTIEDVPFTGGPFLTENTGSTKLVGFARTGGAARSGYYFPAGCTGTLTASGPSNAPFNSNMVGALWLIKHTRDNDNSTTTFAKDTNVVPTLTTYASGAVKIKGDFICTVEPIATGKEARLWRKEGNGNWQQYKSFRGATSFSATEEKDDVYYAMTRSDNTINGTLIAQNATNRGIVRITGYTSSTVVSCVVVDPVLSDNASDNAVTTSMWAEGAWSDYRGYPRTVAFHEDRLWWTSSPNNPDTVWGSKTSEYENMEYTDLGLDNDAVVFPLNDNEVSQIQWMYSRQVMAIGAANKEYRLSAQNPDDPITPTDRKAPPQTGFGSGTIQPALLNNAIFYLQRQGKKLRALKYDAIAENFQSDDVTLMAYGLLDSPPTTIAVQRVPDPIIWITRTDGILPTFTYEPDEEVLGWARQIFGNSADSETATGYIESVAVIHGSSEDEVWVCIRRTIDSSTVYYTELFAPRDWGSDIEDAVFVDSAVTYDSTASSSMTGLDHLEGETVSVFADGEVFDDAVVSSGAITLQKDGVTTTASTVQMGLPYTMKARTMRLAVPNDSSALQATIKSIDSLVVRYIKSINGQAGTEYGGTEYLTPITATYSTESADTPENQRATEGGFNEDAYITIVSSDPVPFTCLSSIVSVGIEK